MKKKTISEVVGEAAADTPPLDFICNELAAGNNLSELAARLGISRQSLSSFAHALALDAKERVREARASGFQAAMERCQKMLEDLGPEPSREALAVVQAKIELVRFQAERQNRSEFGPASAQVNVNFNASIGKSFLDAHRLRSMERATLPAATAVEADYTIESNFDTTSEGSTTGS